MRALTILTLSCTVLAGPATTAQEIPFEGEEEVTAVDVALELAGGSAIWLPGRQTPKAREIRALVDGVDAPVIAVQPPADRFERVVLYFDLPLSDDYQLTWGALLLADRASRLVKLGPVEVVVAAPEPRTLLSPTTDVEALEEALARLAFFGEAQDRLVEHAWRTVLRRRASRPTTSGSWFSTGSTLSSSPWWSARTAPIRGVLRSSSRAGSISPATPGSHRPR